MKSHKIFGGAIDFVNLLALSEDEVYERVAKRDVIHVLGGNSDYLMSVFSRSRFMDVLDRTHDKVYVGSSAGSMVMTQRMNGDAYREIYKEAGGYDVTDYVGRMDFTFVAHLNNPIFNARTPELMKNCAELFSHETYCLTDTQALAIVENSIEYIGGEPLVIRTSSS